MDFKLKQYTSDYSRKITNKIKTTQKYPYTEGIEKLYNIF